MRELYECNLCGLQLRLFMGAGLACPHCPGTFYRCDNPRYGERYQNILQDEATKWEGEPSEFGIERELKRTLEGFDKLLGAESKMDEYDGEE